MTTKVGLRPTCFIVYFIELPKSRQTISYFTRVILEPLPHLDRTLLSGPESGQSTLARRRSGRLRTGCRTPKQTCKRCLTMLGMERTIQKYCKLCCTQEERLICNQSQVDVTEDPLCKEKVIFTLHFKHLQSSDASLLLCLARACRGHSAIADHSNEDVLPILLVGCWSSAVTLNIN